MVALAAVITAVVALAAVITVVVAVVAGRTAVEAATAAEAVVTTKSRPDDSWPALIGSERAIFFAVSLTRPLLRSLRLFCLGRVTHSEAGPPAEFPNQPGTVKLYPWLGITNFPIVIFWEPCKTFT